MTVYFLSPGMNVFRYHNKSAGHGELGVLVVPKSEKGKLKIAMLIVTLSIRHKTAQRLLVHDRLSGYSLIKAPPA